MPVPTSHPDDNDNEPHSPTQTLVYPHHPHSRYSYYPYAAESHLDTPSFNDTTPRSLTPPPAKGHSTSDNNNNNNSTSSTKSTNPTATGSITYSTTMRADRKADTLPASVSISKPSPSSHRTNDNTAKSKDNHSNNHKKRKAASSEPRIPPLDSAAATPAAKATFGRHTPAAAVASGKGKKRLSVDEHKGEEEQDQADYVVEVSGNLRKKRVLATPRSTSSKASSKAASSRHHTHPPPPIAPAHFNAPHAEQDEDVDVEGMGVDEVLPRKNHSQSLATTEHTSTSSDIPSATTKQRGGSRRRGSAVATTSSHPPKKTALSRGADTADLANSEHDNTATTSAATSGDAKPTKASRQPTTAAIPATTVTPVVEQPKAQKAGSRAKSTPQSTLAVVSPGASGAASPPSSASTPSSEPAVQKRVLPSRGRDKNGGLPIEPSLLGPRITPAGEYILYLADKPVLQRTTISPNRVPPAAYNGPEEPETYQSTSTLQSSSSIPNSVPPPSAFTHIEVPIFKQCSINQFLQEEKKRRMQLLSKALAKAEAEAAVEALAGTKGPLPSSSTTSRTVSTRLKHKETINKQHVSVQTAAPSWASSSMSQAGQGRKAVTTSTTLGKIEGVSLNAAHDEILTDEVYEKRHRKQEMAEKKVKNREKEKLRHAMYQQQLVVEKLRHMEINRLMPISAFRSLQQQQKAAEQEKEAAGSGTDNESSSTAQAAAPISLAAAKIMQDEYHRRLLREAEENLRRYEQLGLAENNNSTPTAPTYSPFSRTKNRLAALTPASFSISEEQGSINVATSRKDKSLHQRHESSTSISNVTLSEGRSRKRIRTADLSSTEDIKESSGHPKIKVSSATSLTTTAKKPSAQKTSATPAARPVEPPRPPKPITTFIKPGSILAAGGRKSSRVALAFGEKVPILDRVDFDLPMDVYGELIKARLGESALATPEVKRRREKKSLWPFFPSTNQATAVGRSDGNDQYDSKEGIAAKTKADSSDSSSVTTLSSKASSASSSNSSLSSKSVTVV